MLVKFTNGDGIKEIKFIRNSKQNCRINLLIRKELVVKTILEPILMNGVATQNLIGLILTI